MYYTLVSYWRQVEGGSIVYRMSPAKPVCPVLHRAIELIGSRWTGAIICVLIRDRARFAELRAAIPEISDRMLADRLHALEAEAIVVRTVVPASPVRVEYELTKKGRGLAKALDAIGKWAHRWSDDGAKDAASAKTHVARAERTSARGTGRERELGATPRSSGRSSS